MQYDIEQNDINIIMDDNTFFILMALYNQNEINIPCLSAIYPKQPYTYTSALEQIEKLIRVFNVQVSFMKIPRAELVEMNESEKLAYKSFDKIIELLKANYENEIPLISGVEEIVENDSDHFILDFLSLKLSVIENGSLMSFIDDQLLTFEKKTNRHFNTRAHLRFFKKYYDTYKDKMVDNRYKSYLYKFYNLLGDEAEDEDKYKMVQYLAYLNAKNKITLSKDAFNIERNKRGEHHKRISFNFTYYNANALFGELGEVNDKNIQPSFSQNLDETLVENGRFIFHKDRLVEKNSDKEWQLKTCSDDAVLDLFKKCIIKNQKIVEVSDYIDWFHNVGIKTVKNYYGRVNNLFSPELKVLNNPGRKGKWTFELYSGDPT